MKGMMVYERARSAICPEAVMACLPPRLEAELSRQAVIGHVEELRLRRGGATEIYTLGTSVGLRTVLTGEEMDHMSRVLHQPESVAHSERSIADYISIIRGEAMHRGDLAGDDLLLAAQRKYQQKKAYMEETE